VSASPQIGPVRTWGRLLLMLLVALAARAQAAPGFVAQARADSHAVEVAPGVYLLRGATGEIDSANLGRVGNAGFIVGDSGVIVIDTGTSHRHGQAILDAVAQVTTRPVKLAIVTHTRQEFLFGASAFRERGIPVAMHTAAAQLMAARCEGCLKTLKRTLGEEAMQGTAMFTPDRGFDATHRLDLIGRPVEVLTYGHSSGPGDSAVFDVRSGVLFAGGLVDWMRIPDVQDSELAGWRSALTALRALPVKAVVPGHGPLAPPASIDAVGQYLEQLVARAQTLLDQGAALSEVADRVGLDGFDGWDQYETVHRRNASVVFLRLEREQMFK
jgi:glyoxylase-like metal-dependent hydrolase (beta-lactamase superfamily II)